MKLSNIYYLHEIGGKKTQEDYIWPLPGTATPGDKVFIVCDGVGGSENGEIASRIIAEHMGESLLQLPLATLSTGGINGLLANAQDRLVNYSRQHALNADMATTFSLVVLTNDKAFVAWCGDSRVYHVRNGEILYKTSDHSLVNTLVKKGEITEKEASLHPQKNIILKAIRADYSTIEAEANWIIDIQDGDYFMLCTDGVLENISDNDLRFLLKNDNAGRNLVDTFQACCYNKTRDNYSMYLLQVSSIKSASPQKNKNRFFLSALLILISIAAIVSGYYYANKSQDTNASPILLPVTDTAVNRSLEQKPEKNALPAYEIIQELKKSDSSRKPLPSFTIIKPARDTVHKDTLPVRVKISVPGNKDSIPQKSEITGQKNDSL